MEVDLCTLSGDRNLLGVARWQKQEPCVSLLVERRRKLLDASLKINDEDEDSLVDYSIN